LFRNQRLNIFIYYFFTVTIFLAIFYYFTVILKTENLLLLSFFILIFIFIAGLMIAKLSVDPLQEYIDNLQSFSYETLHELNLPLSTIRSNLSMLQKSILEEKDTKRLNRIQIACDMLQQRYNELDYMIKKQSHSEIQSIFDLSELLQQRVEFLKQIYPHFTFNLKYEKANILNDKIGLSKVIDNIIDNGVKYSENSMIIDISLKEHELCIQDYGRGMDEVELVQIFDKYYQNNKNMQGFGIGLSMVKRFCDNNKILLRFESAPDFGTKVLLKFKKENIKEHINGK